MAIDSSFEQEYISLCSSYIQGQFGGEIPESLNSAAEKLFSECSPETLMKLQVQALKNTLYSVSGESDGAHYFERFGTLTESNYTNLKNVIIEDQNFIINSLAGITEDLDHKVVQLIPYQRKLFKLQQISHIIVKNANFGILAVDQFNTITMFNDAAAYTLGVSPIISQQKFDEAFSSLPQDTLDFFSHCFVTKGRARKEVVVQGQEKVLSVETDILTGTNGEPEGAVLIIFDITLQEQEKKKLEENIKLAAVGQLAAGVAHEIKNPLTVIKGFCQLLLSQEYPHAKQKKFLELMNQEADCANSFIQDFLNLGKPKKPARKTIDACSVVEDVILLLQCQCFLSGITITKELDCPAKIFADPDQLKQVLINLAKNSLEAMEDTTLPSRNLIFRISRDASSAPESLVISVSDTGPGIPKDMLDKVTCSFFTTKKFGTGLGLNISNTIIEQHGGTLQFVSGPIGTSAIIKLPLIAG